MKPTQKQIKKAIDNTYEFGIDGDMHTYELIRSLEHQAIDQCQIQKSTDCFTKSDWKAVYRKIQQIISQTHDKQMETQNVIISELPSHLRVIETTSERNGYPANIRKAVIGFNTFQEAEEMASKHGMEIEFFEKRAGWALWYRTNNTAFGPMKISADDYGDNYQEYDPTAYKDEEDFFDKEARELLQDCDFNNLEEVFAFLEKQKAIYEAIETAQDDELLIVYMSDDRIEVVKKETMEWNHDGRYIAIGLIER